MEWTQQNVAKLYEVIQKKAVVDEDYRQELLENPNAVIEKECGEKLPEGMKIKVVENDPAYAATFVLPDLATGELEDSDLENVAGGISILLVISACAVAVSPGGLCPLDGCAANIRLK